MPVQPLPPHRLPMFHGLRLQDLKQSRGVIAWGGATVLAFGALLLPGHAAAQTVRPTMPASSVTASAAPVGRVGLVELAASAPYRTPGDARAGVAAASNLTPAPAQPPPPQPAPEPAPEPEPEPAWSAPAPGAPISQSFGVPNHEYAAGYHTGVDFAVGSGTPLLAVGDATVASAGWDGAYGQDVVLALPDGHYALYAHMSRLAVHAGEQVSAGQEIGRSGSTGNSTGPHLHFEIRTKNRYGAVVDPVAYLSERGVDDL